MITLDNFEDFVPYKIWMRGEEYYETDAVSELEEISPGEWTATVEGTDDYNVEISMDGNEIESWYCDCPYDGEICKHVVATLLAIRDNRKKAGNSIFSKMKIKAEEAPVLEEIKEVGKQPCPSLVDIQQLLSFIDPQELSKFICEYASTNLEFKTALSNHFIAKELSLSSKGKDYRIEIQKVFKGFGYHKRSRYHNRYDNYDRDWKTIFNQMDTFLEKADFFLNLEAMDNSIAIALQVLRSIGENRMSMLVSLAAMGVNALCNYALIFGRLGMPALGVRGAALGTLIARTVEMLFYLRMLLGGRSLFTLDLRAAFRLPRTVVRAFAVKAVPLILNEILWNVGMNVYFWSYARLDETALPAVTIGEQISTIAAVLAMGTSSAVSVLIGAELGAGRLSQAKSNCKKLLTLVVAIGLMCVALCLGLGAILPNAFGVEPRLRDLAARIATVMGVFSPFNFLYGFCFYCMRAGGDTRSAMLLDSGYMWLVPVPASLLMALLLPGRIDIAAAVLVVQVLMNLKVIPALWVLKRGKWVRNITVEGSQV